MSDEQETQRVFAYSTVDERIFVYDYEESVTQEMAQIFHLDIYFTMTDEEFEEFSEVEQVDNLKNDFIMFRAKVNGLSIMECTCGQFLESGHDHDDLARAAVRHSRKTGHTLNPRGN